MKISSTPKKTTSITVDGKDVPVISLPEEIQNEIHTMDEYFADYINALKQLEKAELLLAVKKEQVINLVKFALKPPAPEETS